MDLLTEFKTYLVTEKGASANTVASYLRDITQYVHYLGEDDRQVLDATSERIEAYRKEMLRMGKSAAPSPVPWPPSSASTAGSNKRGGALRIRPRA